MKRVKRATSENPEVQDAMDVRDELMADAKDAMKEVDRIQGRLLREYEEAERIRDR